MNRICTVVFPLFFAVSLNSASAAIVASWGQVVSKVQGSTYLTGSPFLLDSDSHTWSSFNSWISAYADGYVQGTGIYGSVDTEANVPNSSKIIVSTYGIATGTAVGVSEASISFYVDSSTWIRLSATVFAQAYPNTASYSARLDNSATGVLASLGELRPDENESIDGDFYDYVYIEVINDPVLIHLYVDQWVTASGEIWSGTAVDLGIAPPAPFSVAVPEPRWLPISSLGALAILRRSRREQRRL